MVKYISKNALLEKPEVIDEINRHLWIESEKAGKDIGFEAAAEDWIKKYAKVWVAYHIPQKKLQLTKKVTKTNDSDQAKRRRAQSYLK